MAELVPPTSRVRESFVAALAEFVSEGRGGAGDYTMPFRSPPSRPSMTGATIREHGARLATPDTFERYVQSVRDQALDETVRANGFVPSTTLWWVDGAEYLGRISIRHRLTPQLQEVGGHIGYDVRPTARRRGHATAMLCAALPVARSLGIERALLTCAAENVASRKVIESNGGVPDGRSGRTLYYWVPTAPEV
jgi:predicted acetyltransferase